VPTETLPSLGWETSLGADPALADAGEVDEAALRVGAKELHPHLVPDVEPFPTLLDAALDGRVEDAHPRSLG
jgi:hypothetical protein